MKPEEEVGVAYEVEVGDSACESIFFFRGFASISKARALCEGQVMPRSQSGPGALAACSATPTSSFTPIECSLVRLLLQRRLNLPHFFANSVQSTFLATTVQLAGFSDEGVDKKCCGAHLQEAGGRVIKRDLDLDGASGGDGRRLEVVVDEMPLFGSIQLAVDTTLVSGCPR